MFADQDGQEDPSDVCGDVAGLDGAPWDERLVELVQDSPSEGSGEERQGGPPAAHPSQNRAALTARRPTRKKKPACSILSNPGIPLAKGISGSFDCDER